MFAYVLVVVLKAYDKEIMDHEQPLLVSKLKKIVSVLCCIFLSMVIVLSRLQLWQCGAINSKMNWKCEKMMYNVTAKSWVAVSTTGAFRLKSGKSLVFLLFLMFLLDVRQLTSTVLVFK